MAGTPFGVPAVDDYADESPPSRAPLLVAVASAAVLFLTVMLLIVVVARRQQAAQAPQGGQQRPVARPSAPEFPARSVADDVSEETREQVRELVRFAFAVAVLASYILMLVFVVRDARNRSVDNGALWMITVAVTHFVGLLVYLASRPHGSLVACEHCGNRRLPYVALCPHCRREVKPL